MIHNPSSVSSSLRDLSHNGTFPSIIGFKRPQLSALSSYGSTLGLKFEREERIHKGRATNLGRRIFAYGKPTPKPYIRKNNIDSQNEDLPPVLPRKKKKPFAIPFSKMRQASRKDRKLADMGIEKLLRPPQNGLLVPRLVPVAYEVLDAWKILIKGVSQLMHVVPVYGCCECSEVHVASVGHHIQDCKGKTGASRRSFHSWVRGSINEVIIPIDSYHLFDPFGRRIKHTHRFHFDRIPAIVELCIQAGVELQDYPNRRRTNPIRMIGRKVIDRGGFIEEPPRSPQSSSLHDLDTAYARHPAPDPSEVPRIAQETMEAFEAVHSGVTWLMKRYSVKACGYCSEVHVGPWGHDVKLCGEFKHQWRDGKHGWQDAVVNEVFPPNYVWHARDPNGPPLRTGLRRFYGKAPAVVELCWQAGAEIPQLYKPMMRLDIVIPDDEESRLVA